MLSARIDRGNIAAAFDKFQRDYRARIERAALAATDAARRAAVTTLRSSMTGAGLGRLGNAFTSTSDKAKGQGVHRRTAGEFSASGAVFVRSGSQRSRGAVESYTAGASIRPVRGRWLWIPTDALPRLAGSKRTGGGQRMTPATYIAQGYEQRIGKLIPIRSVDGRPLLAVEKVAVNSAGRARKLLKSGRPGKDRRARELVILFVAIPATSRAARIDAAEIMRKEAATLADRFAAANRRA